MDVKCPSCESLKTYCSAKYMGWVCEDCKKVFQFEDSGAEKSTEKKTKTKTVSSEKKVKEEVGLKLKVGDTDNSGNTLRFRDKVNGITHDIWENKAKTRYYVGIPRTDNNGKTLERTKSFEEAMTYIEGLGYKAEKA